MSSNTIVSFIPVEPENRARIRAIAPDLEFVCLYLESAPIMTREKPDVDGNTDAIRRASVAFGVLPLELVPEMPELRWVHLSMAGADRYCKKGALPDDVLLSCSTGAFGQAISEHMLACTLELIKKLELYRDDMAEGIWSDHGFVRSPEDLTVLVIGLGDIGSRYARLMKLMGSKVIGVRRSGASMPDCVDELYHQDAIDRLLPQADVVALALPNTQETVGLIDSRRLTLMKEGSILLNVGRGNAVLTDDLCAALESGHLAGAALDVTDPEPLPPSHRLWRIPTAVITPHVSGFFHLRKTYDNIIDIFCAELERYVSGQPVVNTVDRSTGYRRTM